MLKPRIIESDVRPEVFLDLGNGNWYYNYDIQSKVVTVSSITEDGEVEEKEETIYNFIQVKMAGKPDYKRCVELIIREYITQSQEFDLINSYNRAALNLLSDEDADKAGIEYIDYLQKVEEIKSKVKNDF